MGKIIKIGLLLVGLVLIVLAVNQYSMSGGNNKVANLNAEKMMTLLQGKTKDALSPEEQTKLEDYSGYAEEARGKAISQKNTGHIMVIAGGLLALAGLVALLKKKKV
jgi:hypothetical protein